MSKEKQSSIHGIGEFLAKNKMWTNFFYGAGAAVVLVGALFKILHLPGAGIMLSIGMGTEAFLFLMSAFELPHKVYHWESVYPELAADFDGERPAVVVNRTAVGVDNANHIAGGMGNLNSLAQSVDIDSNDIIKMTEGIKKLGTVAENLNTLQDLPEASKTLIERLHGASDSVKTLETASAESATAISEGNAKLANSYAQLVKAFEGDFAQISKDTKDYGDNMSVMAGKLSSINAVYELQLKSVNEQLQHMEQLGVSVTKMNDAFAGSVPDANAYKLGAERLKSQIENLNSVYGNMLNALSASV